MPEKIYFYYETTSSFGSFLATCDENALVFWNDEMVVLYRENLESESGLPYVILKQR